MSYPTAPTAEFKERAIQPMTTSTWFVVRTRTVLYSSSTTLRTSEDNNMGVTLNLTDEQAQVIVREMTALEEASEHDDYREDAIAVKEKLNEQGVY